MKATTIVYLLSQRHYFLFLCVFFSINLQRETESCGEGKQSLIKGSVLLIKKSKEERYDVLLLSSWKDLFFFYMNS